MPNRSSKRPNDINQLAKHIVDVASGEIVDRPLAENGKDLAAVLLGRLGGKRGGKARAESLSAERRIEIARAAAKKRWDAPSE